MANEPEVTEVATTKEVVGKTVMSFKLPTPTWANWVFRTVFLLTAALTIYIASTNRIKNEVKVEIILIMKCLDVVVWGAAKGIGVKKEDFEK